VNGGHLSVIRLKDLELRGAGTTVFRATPVNARLGPRRPFVVMNPRSGGGKVARFDQQQRAEALGAEVMLLDRPGTDVQELARAALAGGADLLGVAGGDSQSMTRGVHSSGMRERPAMRPLE
jgi:hypothetical protein